MAFELVRRTGRLTSKENNALLKAAADKVKKERLSKEAIVRKAEERAAHHAYRYEPDKETGRPSSCTPELVDEICARLTAGEALNQMCKDPGYPSINSVLRWVREDRFGFYSKYTAAREIGMDIMLEDIVEISNETDVQLRQLDEAGNPVVMHLNADVIARNRLRVEARKWYLSKVAPKRFGDRVTQELVGEGGGAIQMAAMSLKGLTDEELAVMQNLMSKAAAAA